MLRHYSAERQNDYMTGKPLTLAYRWVDWEVGGELKPDTQAVAMPPETLAIRAGEYGLDPADTDLLLDVVLHETFISYPEGEHPLWTAESIAAAREQHLDTVATVRHEHEERGADLKRAKGYPSKTIHKAALRQTAALSPVHAPVVDAARRMAREHWMGRQNAPARPVDSTGRLLTPVELAVARFSQENRRG